MWPSDLLFGLFVRNGRFLSETNVLEDSRWKHLTFCHFSDILVVACILEALYDICEDTFSIVTFEQSLLIERLMKNPTCNNTSQNLMLV